MAMTTAGRVGGWVVAGLMVGAMAGGCGTSKQSQLEAVAKDWCMTIRASQVIPVYPLTEDVQPGDVYLVRGTTDRQQEQYERKGYLPLDNHVARLDPSGYHEFYDRSFDPKKESALPGTWQLAGEKSAAWSKAPKAAFPTYSFSVSRGAGLNLAVPVSGVPVGLSLLGSEAAKGSISIERARTMGVDIASAYRDLQVWAEGNRDFLAAYAGERRPARKRGWFGGTGEAEKNYLRMITRVYATGKMDVALSDARAGSAGANAGVARPVELLTAKAPAGAGDVQGATLENYRENLRTLNAMLAESYGPTRAAAAGDGVGAEAADAKAAAAGVKGVMPGGSLRVTAASSRYVALQQEFDPPLVLGYLGFDVEIFEDGSIGVPVPTQAMIDSTRNERPTTDMVVEALYPADLPNRAEDELAAATDERSKAAVVGLNALGTRFVPAGKQVVYERGREGIRLVAKEQEFKKDYKGFKAYKANVLEAAELRLALQERKDLTLVGGGGQKEVVGVDSPRWKELEGEYARRQALLRTIGRSERAVVRSAAAAHLWLKLDAAKAAAAVN